MGNRLRAVGGTSLIKVAWVTVYSVAIKNKINAKLAM